MQFRLNRFIVFVKEKIEMAERRKKIYAESSLPYSFEYKMRNAFWGLKCPICGCGMQNSVTRDGDLIIGTRNHIPTIQHNKPISMGGIHELDNISIICRSCNVTIRNKETGKLNNDLVKKVWGEICGRSKVD